MTAGLINKKVQVYDFPDGTIDIRHDGLPLPFTIFDKVCQVKQADIVSNKRLGAVLKVIKEAQDVNAVQRSKKAPKRRGQKQRLNEREVNSAAMS